MNFRLFTFTRINAYGNLIGLHHFGKEDEAQSAMEKAITEKLERLKSCGWDIESGKVAVTYSADKTSAIIEFGESKEEFKISERWIEIEVYIV